LYGDASNPDGAVVSDPNKERLPEEIGENNVNGEVAVSNAAISANPDQIATDDAGNRDGTVVNDPNEQLSKDVGENNDYGEGAMYNATRSVYSDQIADDDPRLWGAGGRL
jgi:hypothetical protein